MLPINDWQRYENTRLHIIQAHKTLTGQKQTEVSIESNNPAMTSITDRELMLSSLLHWCAGEIEKLQTGREV